MKARWTWIPVVLAATSAWAQSDDVQTEMTVPWVEIAQAEVDIHMREGNLILTGGTDDLLRSVFTHREGQKRPHLSFSIDGDKAEIDLDSKGRAEQWEVYLTERVPVDLELKMETGNQRIELDGLQVRKLELEAQTGNTAIQAGGEQKMLQQVRVEHQVGNVAMSFTGRYDQLKDIHLEAGVGEVQLNLTGAWMESASIKIEVESGNVSVVLPRSTGAMVEVKNKTGEVVTKAGVHELRPSYFVNQTFGKGDVSLEIEVEARRGNVFLQEGS